VTIRTDIPLDTDLESLRRRDPDRDRLESLLEELEITERESPS
jgi:hypothetical protein